MNFISYAQNQEDVLLWRALKNVENGFYIDVGANDPEEDSVTKAFYDQGWNGINIEPLPEHHKKLFENRTRDINLAIAAGEKNGSLILSDVVSTRGWASLNEDVVANYKDKGIELTTHRVQVQTLANICDEYVTGDIHFLKVDVEGFETEVVRGMDFDKWRPWIVVIEAIFPNSEEVSYEGWESILIKHCYDFAYFDGLNRYYVAEEHNDLLSAFKVQPNVFDDYVKAGHNIAVETALQAEAKAQTLKSDLTQSEDLLHQKEKEAHDLSGKLEASKLKVDELNKSSHHWYLEAGRIGQELQSAYDSKSWVITWPMRQLSKFIQWFFCLPAQLVTWLVYLPKRIVKWLVLKVMVFMQKHPALKIKGTLWLRRYPRVYNKLRLMSLARGLRVKPTPYHVSQSSAIASSYDVIPIDYDFDALNEIVFSKPSGERKIYYYVDHTIQCPVNTGMQRVVRQLGKALLNAGENVTFVKWNAAASMFEMLNILELDSLSQWNGSKLPEDIRALYPDGMTDSPILIGEHSLEESNWLIVPEVTHITYQPQPMTLDVIMKAKYCGLKTAFVFYDAIPLRRKELNGMAENHSVYMQQLLLVDLIIPISEWSSRDLISYFNIHERSTEEHMPMIKAIPLPGASSLSPRKDTPCLKLESKRFILSVGSIEHRKNQLSLLYAFERYCNKYPSSELELVLVGSVNSDIQADMNKVIGRCKRIKIINALDDQLDKLYSECMFTVFPSVEEGFGLPILESLWYAKPCVCANFGSMAEISEGGGCLMIDTHDSKNIFEAIEGLSSNASLLKKLTTEAAARKIETWFDYGEHFLEQVDIASDPLTRVGSVYYYIDHTCAYDGNTGIQRVVRGLARSLMDNGLNLIPVKWDENEKRICSPSMSELENMNRWNGPSVSQWGEWRDPEKAEAQDWLLVPELTHSITSEIISFSHRMMLRCAYVFYDAIPWKMKDIYLGEAIEAHGQYMEDLNSCEKVFTISKFSRRDLLDFLGYSTLHTPDLENRIQACVLPGEFMETERVNEVKVAESRSIQILCVGTVEPRKNHLALLEAFAQVQAQAERSIELVIAGGGPFLDLNEKVQHYINTVPNIKWEKSPTDDHLNKLYVECDFTVYPSLEEGFGLPILESVWHARPCICRDSGAMEEVAKDGGCLMVDITSQDALAQAMLKLIEDDQLRLDLARECTGVQFKTWSGYGKELAVRLATERAVPFQKEKLNSLEQQDFYKQMVNLNKRPLLSICISTYNRAEWLAAGLRNLERLLPESNPCIEIVVCDNTSTDHTSEVVKPYLKRNDFHYYCNPVNVGMLGNLRVTAHHAKGEYIWILGDDDLIKPGCVERVLKIIRENPELALIYMNYAYHRQDDIKEVEDYDAFMLQATPVAAPSDDIKGRISDISAESENFFTAIYCLIYRRDHALRAYSQNTEGRPFSTMLTCIPTTHHVLNHMMHEPGYWIGEPQLVVNLNVSWMKYAPLWILERLPEAHDLAEKMGANKNKMNTLRNKHIPHVVHWFSEIYQEDKVGNIQYFKPERLVFRMNHLSEFYEVSNIMRECYKDAYLTSKQNKISPEKLFSNMSK